MPAADIAELERQTLEASFWEIREGPNTARVLPGAPT
jgi:hypothetical protein